MTYSDPELAPEQCIVCGKKPAKDEAARKAEGWVYLAGATPLGALACGAECAVVAVERWKRTGRVDERN